METMKIGVKRAILNRLLLSLSLALSLLGTNAVAETFTFTAIPDQDETHLVQRFGKVADHLSKELGVEVKYMPVKNYSAAVTAFRNNQVQLAWFGGLSGVRARLLVANSRAIAQGTEDAHFRTHIIANTRTGLTESDSLPADVRDYTFTFGSKGSTSGRLMPEFFLREHYKASPDETFKRIGFSGDHSRTIALVQSGAYDMGAVNFEVWKRELAEGKVDPEQVQVIWTTPDYPDYQWTVRGDIDEKFGEGFADKIQETLLNMKDPDLLKSFPRSGFIPATNDDYQPILDTAKSLDLIDG